MDDKTLQPVKASILDNDAFRLLALPFGGPIPYPGAPKGVDMDRQWFDADTDFGRPPKRVPVTWHHGLDPKMGKAAIADAGDLEWDDEGGWVTVWLRHGERRVDLVRKLADKGGRLFGSSEAAPGSGQIRAGKAVLPWHRDMPGQIVRWHYSGQTLSTSPQNTLSVLRPMKATLDELKAGTLDPTSAFFDDLASFMDNLTSRPAADPTGEVAAKAGRVLAARNEAKLREALAAMSSVLDELNKYVTTTEDTDA